MNFFKKNDILILDQLFFSDVETFKYFHGSESIEDKIKLRVEVFDIDSQRIDDQFNLSYLQLKNEGLINLILPEERESNGLSTNATNGAIKIKTKEILEGIGYLSGRYKATYWFYYDVLGSEEIGDRVYIRDISNSKLELVIGNANENLDVKFRNVSRYHFYRYGINFHFNKFMNMGDNTLLSLVNAKNEYDANNDEHVLILKLYDKLPTKYKKRDSFYIIELISDTITDTVELIPDFDADQYNILKRPDFASDAVIRGDTEIGFKSYEDIIPNIKYVKDITKDIVNFDLLDYDKLGIDYSIYSNFVRYGSATDKLDNFISKYKKIKYHDDKLEQLASASSENNYISSASFIHEAEREQIINNLTGYERFLLFDSSSLYTSSIYDGATLDACWPKSNSTKPYTLYDTGSAEFAQWYTTQSNVAFNYDIDNLDYLYYNLPEYIKYDPDKYVDYIKFVNMIGEIFDSIWLFIEHQNKKDRREDLIYESIPRNLIWDTMRDFGFDMINDFSAVNLTKFKYGFDVLSETYISGIEKAQKEITNEVWNRILVNYPYLAKSKGTRKAIYSVLNCYGIPSDLISIREFGGPRLNASTEKYEFDTEDFTHVIDFTGDEKLIIPWHTGSSDGSYPDSIELKFKTNYKNDIPIFELTQSDNSDYNLGVYLTNHIGDERGRIHLRINTPIGTEEVSSSIYNFYDDSFYNICYLRDTETDDLESDQDYILRIRKYDEQLKRITIVDELQINMTSSDSASYNSSHVGNGTLYMAGSGSNKFVGSMDEIRIWGEPIASDTFEWHSKYPSSTNGNFLTSSLDSLWIRLSFEDVYDLYATSSISNVSFSENYNELYISANNFNSGSDVYPYHFSYIIRNSTGEYPFMSPSSANDKKIRIDNNQITQEIKLPTAHTVKPLKSEFYDAIVDINGNSVIINGDQSIFSDSDMDSDKLIIAFSYSDVVNRDIISFYGNNNVLSSFAEPDNIYKDGYPKISNYYNRLYWENTKNPLNFYEFINYVKSYNNSLFEMLKNFIPADMNAKVGVLYESTMLHRSRARIIKDDVGINYKQYVYSHDTKPNRDSYGENIGQDIKIDSKKTRKMDSSYIYNKIDIEDSELYNLKSEFKSANINIDSKLNERLMGNQQKVDSIIEYKYNEYNLISKHSYNIMNNRYTGPNRFSNNFVNTSKTTSDRGPVIVVNRNTGKRLRVDDSDNPKLIIDD